MMMMTLRLIYRNSRNGCVYYKSNYLGKRGTLLSRNRRKVTVKKKTTANLMHPCDFSQQSILLLYCRTTMRMKLTKPWARNCPHGANSMNSSTIRGMLRWCNREIIMQPQLPRTFQIRLETATCLKFRWWDRIQICSSRRMLHHIWRYKIINLRTWLISCAINSVRQKSLTLRRSMFLASQNLAKSHSLSRSSKLIFSMSNITSVWL